jgi:hypothetical protein
LTSGTPIDAAVAQAEVDEEDEHDEREGRPVPGSQVQRQEPVDERQVDLVDRRDALAAGGQRPAEQLDLVAVDGDAPDDLAERERDDRDVVAAQAQGRQADQHPGDRRGDDRQHEDQQEVEVDAREVRGGLADEDVDPLAAAGVLPEARAEVAHDVRPDREERDVAEVEQAGEADDDVQAQRHAHVGQGEDHVVHDVAALAEEERQDHRDAQEDRRDDQVLPLGQLRRAEPGPRLLGRGSGGAHPASLVSSPSRPDGLKTMMRTRYAKT